jgi:hypothetical protein
MKTFLLSLLLLASAAQADQWLVNGKAYNGTIHKFNADQTMIWVTSDWDSYAGSWLKVADLDSFTRVRLNVATPQEQAAVAAELERLRQMEAQADAQAQARAAAERTARIEEQKLALEREKLNFQRQQEANRHAERMRQQQQQQRSSTKVYIVPGNAQRVPQNPGVQVVQPTVLYYK